MQIKKLVIKYTFNLSIIFYVISLFLPVSKDIFLGSDIDVGSRLHYGIDFLLEGWEGLIFMSIPAWVANITYFITLILTNKKKNLKAALILSYITLFLGLTSLVLSFGRKAPDKNVEYLIGFYFWISSFILLIFYISASRTKVSTK